MTRTENNLDWEQIERRWYAMARRVRSDFDPMHDQIVPRGGIAGKSGRGLTPKLLDVSSVPETVAGVPVQ